MLYVFKAGKGRTCARPAVVVIRRPCEGCRPPPALVARGRGGTRDAAPLHGTPGPGPSARYGVPIVLRAKNFGDIAMQAASPGACLGWDGMAQAVPDRPSRSSRASLATCCEPIAARAGRPTGPRPSSSAGLARASGRRALRRPPRFAARRLGAAPFLFVLGEPAGPTGHVGRAAKGLGGPGRASGSRVAPLCGHGEKPFVSCSAVRSSRRGRAGRARAAQKEKEGRARYDRGAKGWWSIKSV